jgi:PKD repeat protein
MRVVKLVIFLSILAQTVYAQTDNTFWFAAPDISSQHGDNPWNGAPLNLHVTAVHATHVKISRPAEPTFTPIEFDLAEMEHRTIRLDTWPGLAIDHIETYPMADLVTGVQNKGFLIETDPGEVTVYYELDQYWNRDIFPLKGKNALGKEFRISLQKTYPNGAYGGTAWSGFVIVATEDNTTVTVNQNAAWLYFPAFPAVRTVILNKGETFSFQASSTAAAQHISGVLVTSTKNIAITIFDDSIRKKNSAAGGCGSNISYDLVGDQTVPTSLVGLEYIVMKGEVTNVAACDGGERIFITSTQPNTKIYIDGNPVEITTIGAAGGLYSYPITNNSTHIRGSKPIYIFHTTGFGGELGGAVLPTIDGCTGSNDVTFTRTPNTLDQFRVNIMVRNDTLAASIYRNQAINNFTVTVNGITDTIPSVYFEYIMDSTFAVLRDLPAVDAFFASHITPGDEARVSNHVSRFHLGIINGGASTGCKYGYFSDYAASSGLAGLGGAVLRHQKVYCNLDPIQLVASGGRAYEWECISNPVFTQYITDTTIADPYFFPPDSGFFRFNVKIIGECSYDTTIVLDIHVFIGPTSDFTLSPTEGCSPFTSVLTNITNTAYAKEMIWVFENPYMEINQDTIPFSFPYSLPENNSDSIQTYRIQLISWESDFHECPNTKVRYVKVKPEVKADFSANPFIGCHPLITTFSDSSSGHLDSTSYFWDFGDWTQSFEQNPIHSFENFSLIDSTYDVSLITESPLGCLDTIIKTVTVHPRVRTSLAINTAASCSPLDITVNPLNSIGVDTFFWQVHSPDALGTGSIDTSYITPINMPVTVYHYDSSYASPDTILINLTGMNRMGCTDIFPQRNIVVFPELISRFSIPNDSICDADSILFSNESVGYNLFYEWDFDDGTVLQDTTDNDYMHPFFNRSDKDSSYRVTLLSTSGYLCESTFDTVIVVHPYIKANFGMDYENNCTPILTTFTNLSIRAHQCDWDFGDDSTSATLDSVFTHQFWNNSATGDTTYFVNLVVHNNEGCSDSIRRTIDIFPHVVAVFEQTDSIGCSPLTVSFNNYSSGGILSYLWDFGNGTSSTNPTPTSRLYTNYSAEDTTYYTSLTAINPYGCDSTINDSVTVFAMVDADFNLPRADSCSPFKIRPANLSSIGAHVYEWDFLGTGLPTSNAYEPIVPPFSNTSLTEDTVNIRLIAYSFNDAPHRACADTQMVRVLVYPELDVDFNLDNGLASCQPYISPITQSANLPTGNYFQWYIDSVFYSADQNPPLLNIPNLESYDVPHSIWMYGESMHGCRDTASEDILVYSLVDSRFTINSSGICSADTFEIDRRTSRGGITNYIWNFQGTLYNIPDSVFDYSYNNFTNALVNQRIILIARNSQGCVDSSTHWIDVYPEVRANFDLNDHQVCYPFETSFTNTTENANNYNWNFGDGTGSNDMIPGDHIFQNFDIIDDATYNIWLIARSQYNCYDSAHQNLTVYAKPYAEFTFPQADCPPFNADMTNVSQGFDLSYYWLFDNADVSTLEEPEYTFSNSTSNVRNIPIMLIATSGMGCSDSSFRELSVYPDVVVSFTMSETEGCSPLSVDFNGSAPNVDNMIWYIDGQAFSTLEDATYRFSNNSPNTRDYTVSFRGQSLYGCEDDTSMTVTVYSSPSAEFIPDPLIQDYNMIEDQTTVNFSNQTYFQNNWQYFWDFGDGNTDNSNALAFDHIYGYEFWGTAANNFKIPVSMVAWNDEMEECRDTVVREIYIKPPLPQVSLEEDISGCEPLTVTFTPTTRYVHEGQYLWDLGSDGATSTVVSPSYTYNENGTYTVKLIVEGDGGTNWDYQIITVNPKPEIDFTFNDSIVFVRSQNQPDEVISFYNHTRYGQDYYWFFEETVEDGSQPIVDMVNAQSTEEEPTWYYEEPGVYSVVLLASSGEGCLDTMVSPIPIYVLGEGMIQFPTGFFVDPSEPRDENISDPEDPSRNIFRGYGQGVAEFHLEVYNRWGVMVFRSDDINKGWNGFIDGAPAKQDVYVWRAKGRFTNGQPYEMSGDVTLIVAPDIGQVH